MVEATTDDVRDALSHLNTADFDAVVFENSILVTVSESEAGAFFKALRVNGYEFTAKRLDDALVARIQTTESDTTSLADLFG